MKKSFCATVIEGGCVNGGASKGGKVTETQGCVIKGGCTMRKMPERYVGKVEEGDRKGVLGISDKGRGMQWERSPRGM